MSWMLTAVAITAVGTTTAGYGQYQAGRASQMAADYNAKLARNEAIAKEQATKAETERMLTQQRALTASQRAGYAKSGGMITEGTPLLVMAEQAGVIEKDIITMQRTGLMQQQASVAEARLQTFTGKSAMAAGQVLSAPGSRSSSVSHRVCVF